MSSRYDEESFGREDDRDRYRQRDFRTSSRQDEYDRKRDDADRLGYRGSERQSDYGSSYGSSRNRSGYQGSQRNYDRDYGMSNRSRYGDYSDESRRGFPSRRYEDEGMRDYSNESQFNDRHSGGYRSGGRESYRQQSYQPSYGNYDRESSRRNRDYYDDDRYNRQTHHRNWWERMTDELASWFGDEEAERRRRMDEARTGQQESYRGKGPRNYKRSDERIREDVNDRLTDYDYVDASDIDVIVASGVVTLDGNVNSHWAKRTAEDLVESVSGVQDVRNNLTVGQSTTESSGLTTPRITGTTPTRASSQTQTANQTDSDRATKATASGGGA